ncbi:Nipped-B-like protein [Trichoplax sp. H2]|nr:Nipped-B-like protein [Trichoplax sp. H2]|eukprot:RDD46191.1 Nipped-B-like protein [Trichoplax sp. H2]
MADYNAPASSYQSSSKALANTLIGPSTLIDLPSKLPVPQPIVPLCAANVGSAVNNNDVQQTWKFLENTTDGQITEKLGSDLLAVDVSHIQVKEQPSLGSVSDLRRPYSVYALEQRFPNLFSHRSSLTNPLPDGHNAHRYHLETSDESVQDVAPHQVFEKRRIQPRKKDKPIYKFENQEVITLDSTSTSAVSESDSKDSTWKCETTSGTSDSENFVRPGPSSAKKSRKTSLKNKSDQESEYEGESTTYKRFVTLCEKITDYLKKKDESSSKKPDKLAVPLTVLSELSIEAARLKATNEAYEISLDDVEQVVKILLGIIRHGKCIESSVTEEPADDKEKKLWNYLKLEEIAASMEATVAVLHILTAKNMPKTLYADENIDSLIDIISYHQVNTLYPIFDPMYKDKSADNSLKSDSNRLKGRGKVSSPKNKLVNFIYRKTCEAVALLSELVQITTFTDTIIIQLSSIGISSFFVDNVKDLQRSALDLIRWTFKKYDKHRNVIIEDILSSLVKLPSNRTNLRCYNLGNGESIQIVSALILQLFHCMVKIPVLKNSDSKKKSTKGTGSKEPPEQPELIEEHIIGQSYESAVRNGQSFITQFFKKYCVKDEEDRKVIFENFIQDLLITVDKPEWPSSELLLGIVGKCLAHTFTDKSNDIAVRTTSLEYFGLVAAHLRKRLISIEEIDLKALQSQISEISHESVIDDSNDILESVEYYFEKILIGQLYSESKDFPWYQPAVYFRIGRLLYETHKEIEKQFNESANLSANLSLEDSANINEDNAIIESLKKKLSAVTIMCRLLIRGRWPKLTLSSEVLESMSQKVVSKRSLFSSFDTYLQHLLRMLYEPTIALRARALKCLTSIIGEDPNILRRKEVHQAVHARLLDTSVSVREAAVELTGKFMLTNIQLCEQYFEILIERILDTGISVRKRVIKVLKDLYTRFPAFEKNPEICVRILLRFNDDESVKDLVTKVFQHVWFSCDSKSGDEVKKVTDDLVNCVAICHDSALECLENLIRHMVKSSDFSSYSEAVTNSSKVILANLLESILKFEDQLVNISKNDEKADVKVVACFSTLLVFSKCFPQLVVDYAPRLQPYLSMKCSTKADAAILRTVPCILEYVLPLMQHPSKSFLADLEKDLMKLILIQGQTVVQNCISCLTVIVNEVTHNYDLVRDCLRKYIGLLRSVTNQELLLIESKLTSNKPRIMRALFVVGMLYKNFDMDLSSDSSELNLDSTFELFLAFCQCEDGEVLLKAFTGIGSIEILTSSIFFLLSLRIKPNTLSLIVVLPLNAIGSLCVRYPKLLMHKKLSEKYKKVLNSRKSSTKLMCQVLKNIEHYLIEEDKRTQKAEDTWKKSNSNKNLGQLGDARSSTQFDHKKFFYSLASKIVQHYANEVLEASTNSESEIRNSSLNVILRILRDGLMHPIKCVPYLITLSTDPQKSTKILAEKQLSTLASDYLNFVQSKAAQGIRLTFELHKKLQGSIVRGYSKESASALCSCCYMLLRSNRRYRRALAHSLLRYFETDNNSGKEIEYLLYIAGNLAYFPYNIQDEPLFLIHQLDLTLSVMGTNLLDAVGKTFQFEDSEEDLDSSSVDALKVEFSNGDFDYRRFIYPTLSCLLLIQLRDHLKSLYSISESKCIGYSPSDNAKVNDKSLTRRNADLFDPRNVIENMKNQAEPAIAVKLYLQLKSAIATTHNKDYDDGCDAMLSIAEGEEDIKEGNKIFKYPISGRNILIPQETGIRNHVKRVDGAIKRKLSSRKSLDGGSCKRMKQISLDL